VRFYSVNPVEEKLQVCVEWVLKTIKKYFYSHKVQTYSFKCRIYQSCLTFKAFCLVEFFKETAWMIFSKCFYTLGLIICLPKYFQWLLILKELQVVQSLEILIIISALGKTAILTDLETLLTMNVIEWMHRRNLSWGDETLMPANRSMTGWPQHDVWYG
jgi:hypothetical protein